ncbi:MAG TPA: hypothetical protein VHK28_01725, partial [Candidatus Limnocylindria bacterium]|nr:hypothetical protein [Candidatus Limnocylindria bacterium]
RDDPIRPGDWSPKDHQAHLTAWKARQARRFDSAREGIEVPAITEGDETDAINAELHATRADWTWEAIAREADEVSERLVQAIEATDPEMIAATDRLLGGTFGNGAFHAIAHFGWLIEADVGIDTERVDAFLDETLALVRRSAVPRNEVAAAVYNTACHYALRGQLNEARPLLREAFSLSPELLEWSRQDEDLRDIRDELAALAPT